MGPNLGRIFGCSRISHAVPAARRALDESLLQTSKGYSMSVSCVFDRRRKKRRRKGHSFPGKLESLEQRLALSTYIVNSAYDQPAVDPSSGAETASGTITFRSAIQAANVHPNDASGPDRIEFDIPG